MKSHNNPEQIVMKVISLLKHFKESKHVFLNIAHYYHQHLLNAFQLKSLLSQDHEEEKEVSNKSIPSSATEAESYHSAGSAQRPWRQRSQQKQHGQVRRELVVIGDLLQTSCAWSFNHSELGLSYL